MKLTLILDLIHVLERVWRAAHVFQPEGTAEAEVHAKLMALRILEGDVAQVIKGLRQTVTKRRLIGSEKKALLAVATYFENNAAYMRYNEYLALGFPIASGPVEGACKNLIKDRIERSAMRWTPSMAEAVVKLFTSAETSTFTGPFTSLRINSGFIRPANGPSSQNRHTLPRFSKSWSGSARER